MNSRLNFVPDPAFAALTPLHSDRQEQTVASLQHIHFNSILDPLMRDVLERGFAETGAHEGTLWVLDPSGQFLVPAYNTGPNAEQLVGRFKQPLSSGLICMVFASEQPFLENDVSKNAAQSKLLDSQLAVQTCAMIAVPLYFLRACRGVISSVQLKRANSKEPDPPGFRPEHLARAQITAALLARLIEFRLLGQTVGWTSA
jgi:hypothetical protein